MDWGVSTSDDLLLHDDQEMLVILPSLSFTPSFRLIKGSAKVPLDGICTLSSEDGLRMGGGAFAIVGHSCLVCYRYKVARSNGKGQGARCSMEEETMRGKGNEDLKERCREESQLVNQARALLK